MFTVTYVARNGVATSVTDDPERFAQTWDVIVLAVSERHDMTDIPPITGNCLYNGEAIGHSKGFCTADSCY